MYSQFVQSLTSGSGLTSSFVQAANSIKSYCTWIASQSVGDAGLNATLVTIKTHAASWYNSIYPTYLDMPDTITTSGTQITGDLNMLISLAKQLQTAPSSSLEQQITQYANALIGTLTGLQTEMSSLATDIATFGGNLTSDARTMQSTMQSITVTINNLNNQLVQLYGQLHALQNATCPNQGDINACNNSINAARQQLETEIQAANIFNQALNMCQSAIGGAGYLASFWQGMTADTGSCIASLQQISSVSATILLLDLESNQANWNNLDATLQQISQQIST